MKRNKGVNRLSEPIMDNVVSFEDAIELRIIGFDEPVYARYYEKTLIRNFLGHNAYYHNSGEISKEYISAPSFAQIFKWFRFHGYFYYIYPEFYAQGINFNWQIFWYLPKEEWTEHMIHGGTGMYGDNNEFPTHEDAELGALRKMIELYKEHGTKSIHTIR